MLTSAPLFSDHLSRTPSQDHRTSARNLIESSALPQQKNYPKRRHLCGFEQDLVHVGNETLNVSCVVSNTIKVTRGCEFVVAAAKEIHPNRVRYCPHPRATGTDGNVTGWRHYLKA